MAQMHVCDMRSQRIRDFFLYFLNDRESRRRLTKERDVFR